MDFCNEFYGKMYPLSKSPNTVWKDIFVITSLPKCSLVLDQLCPEFLAFHLGLLSIILQKKNQDIIMKEELCAFQMANLRSIFLMGKWGPSEEVECIWDVCSEGRE